jgi:hypothetical protein
MTPSGTCVSGPRCGRNGHGIGGEGLICQRHCPLSQDANPRRNPTDGGELRPTAGVAGEATRARIWEARLGSGYPGRLAMHAIVLIENWYSIDHTERHNFAATVAPIAHNTAVRKLDENLWQIDFQVSPAPLGLLIAACERHLIPYRVLVLAQSPAWSPPLPILRGDDPNVTASTRASSTIPTRSSKPSA